MITKFESLDAFDKHLLEMRSKKARLKTLFQYIRTRLELASDILIVWHITYLLEENKLPFIQKEVRSLLKIVPKDDYPDMSFGELLKVTMDDTSIFQKNTLPEARDNPHFEVPSSRSYLNLNTSCTVVLASFFETITDMPLPQNLIFSLELKNKMPLKDEAEGILI